VARAPSPDLGPHQAELFPALDGAYRPSSVPYRLLRCRGRTSLFTHGCSLGVLSTQHTKASDNVRRFLVQLCTGIPTAPTSFGNPKYRPSAQAIAAAAAKCAFTSPISNALRGRLELTSCLHQTGHYRRRRHNRTPTCPIRGPGRCQFTTRTYLIPKSQILLGFLRYRKGPALQPCAQEEAEEEAGRP
jgi:hypothetical protein